MTVGTASPAVAAVVLLVVALIGVAAGRATRRWSLLLGGLLAVLVLAVAITAATGAGGDDDPATELTALYSVALPLLVAFGAGWSCGRTSWLRRFLVVTAAVLVLAVFPYGDAGRRTADAFPDLPTAGTGVPAHRGSG